MTDKFNYTINMFFPSDECGGAVTRVRMTRVAHADEGGERSEGIREPERTLTIYTYDKQINVLCIILNSMA